MVVAVGVANTNCTTSIIMDLLISFCLINPSLQSNCLQNCENKMITWRIKKKLKKKVELLHPYIIFHLHKGKKQKKKVQKNRGKN